MANKLTAVEWLVEELNKRYSSVNFDKLFNQAKAMEKEHIQLAKKESYDEGWLEATQYIFKKYKQEEDDKI